MQYEFNLTIKAICLFEQLSKKSFFEPLADKDVMLLVYSIFSTSNPSEYLTYQAFLTMLGNKKVANWLMDRYSKVMAYIKQFKTDTPNAGEGEGGEVMTMTKVASSLIIQHKVDAHYVMYEMSLHEITPFLQIADDVKKAEMVEERFWTYLQVAPHIDTKKVKSPKALITFDWEKKKDKEEALKDLESKQDFIKDFFRKQKELKKQKEDGRQYDNNNGPTGPGKGIQDSGSIR